jgi:hypothetical protein
MINRNGILYGAIAGTEIDGVLQVENNRILVFIDSKTGGFNTLASWVNRSGVPANTNGLLNLNGGIVFDAGFEADYILAINRANLAGTTYYDLYDMVANTNSFLGQSPSAGYGFQENAADGDLTKGFEFALPLSAIGVTTGVIKVFGMLVNNPNANQATLLSNQFISVAGSGELNYGDGAVFFNNAAPNPVLYQVTQDCYRETCVTVQQSVTPLFDPIAPLCSGAAAPTLPANSTNGVGGTWSPAVVSNTASGSYLFTPSSATCTGTATLNVTVNPRPTTDGIFHE